MNIETDAERYKRLYKKAMLERKALIKALSACLKKDHSERWDGRGGPDPDKVASELLTSLGQ